MLCRRPNFTVVLELFHHHCPQLLLALFPVLEALLTPTIITIIVIITAILIATTTTTTGTDRTADKVYPHHSGLISHHP